MVVSLLLSQNLENPATLNPVLCVTNNFVQQAFCFKQSCHPKSPNHVGWISFLGVEEGTVQGLWLIQQF
jgi:hypothetical protein